VTALEIINLRQPSEVREFPYGQPEVFHIAGQVIGRATYQPGWRWSRTPPCTCPAPTPTPAPPPAERPRNGPTGYDPSASPGKLRTGWTS
jgi:hypothetical protein